MPSRSASTAWRMTTTPRFHPRPRRRRRRHLCRQPNWPPPPEMLTTRGQTITWSGPSRSRSTTYWLRAGTNGSSFTLSPAWDWKPEQKVREESEEVANSLKFLNWLNDCYSVLLWHFTAVISWNFLPKICSQPCPAHRPIMSLSWNPSLCCKTCDSIK